MDGSRVIFYIQKLDIEKKGSRVRRAIEKDRINSNRGGYMKLLTTVLFGCLLSTAAFAGELTCPDVDKEDALESAIQWVTDATTCRLAVARAKACAEWGSTADGAIISPAAEICRRELDAKNPTQEELNTVMFLQGLCTAKYSRESGSMWSGPRAFCYLRQVTNLLDLKTTTEEDMGGFVK